MNNLSFDDLPHQSPIEPTKLNLTDTIQFRCHKKIACFNECCKRIDILLTPYDILRLKKHFNLTSSEFLAQYTLPYEMDQHGMPGVKIRTADDNPACPFLQEKGCSVYKDRPSACRYYALGLLSLREQNSSTDKDYYFLIKEKHCFGHQEPRQISIQNYRQEQELELYDEMNRDWRQIILKKRSAGPAIGKPTLRSFQFFFLASYNLDEFKKFLKNPGFIEVYDLNTQIIEQIISDDEVLLKFAGQLLKQVLFGELTIPLKENAMQTRVQRRRDKHNIDPDNPNNHYLGPEMI